MLQQAGTLVIDDLDNPHLQQILDAPDFTDKLENLFQKFRAFEKSERGSFERRITVEEKELWDRLKGRLYPISGRHTTIAAVHVTEPGGKETKKYPLNRQFRVGRLSTFKDDLTQIRLLGVSDNRANELTHEKVWGQHISCSLTILLMVSSVYLLSYVYFWLCT